MSVLSTDRQCRAADELLTRYNAWLYFERTRVLSLMHPGIDPVVAFRFVPEDRFVNLYLDARAHRPLPDHAAVVLRAAGVSIEGDVA